MTRWAALLKGVNVGGNRRLPMADLRRFAEGLGFTDVKTLLASGNLVFSSDETSAAALESRLEDQARAQLGLDTAFLVRDAADLRSTIAGNPFAAQAAARPNHLLVHFHRDAVPLEWVAAVRAEIDGPERIAASGRELFVDYADGIAGSTLAALITRARHRRLNTARNWNTVVKLLAMLETR
ncbi:DUF1697 domain-containing protein [Sphingomonas sp.]|uniref:DUF1697 domain-containing protein n=1 Tax=Sphingomonas sp. TaxID=28214 RepID=UPI002BCBDF21|nr:DUF1697 domain-containing protein [Sphingomonas sp.]HWK37188.1 DUF1697 domain-containing protein [Sphingomonas sp.]